MKFIKISTDQKTTVEEFPGKQAEVYKFLGEQVGGFFEVVNTRTINECLGRDIRMIVNEEGLIYDMEVNSMGCFLYCGVIVGDVIIGREIKTSEGPDIGGLTEDDVERVLEFVKAIRPRILVVSI